MTTEELPTQIELAEERAELVKGIANWEAELSFIRGLRLPDREYWSRREGITGAIKASRVRLTAMKVEMQDAFKREHNDENSGRIFWRERSDDLVDCLDAVLDDDTASPTVQATVNAALRAHRRSMTPKSRKELTPVDTFLEERDA